MPGICARLRERKNMKYHLIAMIAALFCVSVSALDPDTHHQSSRSYHCYLGR